jgi:hypothetical protein
MSYFTGFNSVRIALGLVLLIAAGLKGHEFATEPAVRVGLFESRWFLIGLIELEFSFGVWLLLGFYARVTWRLAMICFSTFAILSLVKALWGYQSCGCFGKVAVNPWLTIGVDCAAVSALFRWRPARVSLNSHRGHGPIRFAGTLALVLLVAIPTGVAIDRIAVVGLAGEVLHDTGPTAFDPENWIGKPFPLLDDIDVGHRLATGRWIVILHRPGCVKCKQQIPRYEHAAFDLQRQKDAPSMAMIEVPPYSHAHGGSVIANALWITGRLSQNSKWSIAVPIELELDHGTVLAHGDRCFAQEL